MVLLWILFGIFVVLQVLDVLTTQTVLEKGGRELNFIVKFLMDKFGVNRALYGSKIIALMVLLYIMVYTGPRIANYIIFIVFDLFYAYVVFGNNIKVLKKLEDVDKYD